MYRTAYLETKYLTAKRYITKLRVHTKNVSEQFTKLEIRHSQVTHPSA